MDPNQLLAAITPQVQNLARAEADRAAGAALAQARADMLKGFVLAVIVSVAIAKIWK